MRDSILQRIFRRVQTSDSEGKVLDAILSKANIYGKHAKIAVAAIAGITGFSKRHVKRLVKSLIFKRRLLRVDKRVLWYCHNAIHVYHVVIPWRQDSSYQERGPCQSPGKIGRKPFRSDRVNTKGDKACHPNIHQEEKSPYQPTQMCSEAQLAEWLTPGSGPWYYAQGLTPPWENGENGNGNGS
jgi:hypothetical protein